ncbi:putative acyl-[acyl-carrier-protein] desaturase desA1 [Mycobacterium xenopi 4042]|uniref:Putative acyl-[acyl-carrier-protein] desaturase desA1 n=1 Tax=Mycobacterium xenopi 4042 TaxID=1299334 RepID=X7ZVB8_MYCXE|nr:putative acyl-[acyl-carrier-protein] desaturase desA1 [Mycobacterium xenopi 4042]
MTFQELATRVSHRNTGKACNETIADQLMARISADENLHMIFYRDVSEAAFDIAPNVAMWSLHRVLRHFKMPGFLVPEFRRKAVIIAVGGVYDVRIHLEDVVKPVLKKWRIFERDDFTGEAAWMQEDLALLMDELEKECEKFEASKQRYLERQAAGRRRSPPSGCSTPRDASDESAVADVADRSDHARQPGGAGPDGGRDECGVSHAVSRAGASQGRDSQRALRL